MTDVLCKWLNERLKLSKVIEPQTIAQDFSSAYLFGEVLHKYELQNDFSLFLKKDTCIANFSRLEPTLRLLGIHFDINTAQELTQEKPGVATSLLYQLYVSLEKKMIAKISRTMKEVMQPAAVAALHIKECELFRHGLEHDRKILAQIMSSQCQSSNRWPVIPPIQKKKNIKTECTDLHQDRDCLMVDSLPPPPRPPTLEKPMASTPTITQLKSLEHS